MWTELLERLRAHGGLKSVLTVVLAIVLCVPYYSLQSLRGSAAFVMPHSALDDAIPYDERWIWVYLTLYGIMLAPPWLSRSRDALVRFAAGFVVLCAVSHTIFLVLPTAIAPSGVAPTDPAMRFVLSFDGQANALPSLHASLAFFAAFSTPMLVGRSKVIAVAALLWACAIAFSTLPTRRHVVADLVAGGVLAALVFAVVARASRAPVLAPEER